MAGHAIDDSANSAMARRTGLVWRFRKSPRFVAGSERISESLATLEMFDSSVLLGFEVRREIDP
jgi:hypothetical protein